MPGSELSVQDTDPTLLASAYAGVLLGLVPTSQSKDIRHIAG